MTTEYKVKTDELEMESFASEFLAALEAATSQKQPNYFSDPMTPAAQLEGLSRVLMTPRPDRGLEVLARTGVMHKILPEVAALIDFGDAIRHKDVWAHTKQVVRQTPMRLMVRWGALLHDVGKVPTRRFTPDGQVTFIGHPEIGARMFERIAQRLPFPDDARTTLRFLIAAHLRGASYQESWTDAAVRRFAKDVGPMLDDLLDLARSDITSKYEEKVKRGLRQINLLAVRIEEIKALDARPKALPKGLGKVLIDTFRLPPGRGLGRLMDRLKEDVESGQLDVHGEFDYYVSYVNQNPQLLELAKGA